MCDNSTTREKKNTTALSTIAYLERVDGDVSVLHAERLDQLLLPGQHAKAEEARLVLNTTQIDHRLHACTEKR